MQPLNAIEQKFWNAYLESAGLVGEETPVYASIAGNFEIADELLNLYLAGKKTACSGLVKEYEKLGEPLPQAGSHWIVLDSKQIPRCIVRTIRTEIHTFENVGADIARAEGEGDLSLTYWRKAHSDFFKPFLDGLGIRDLNQAEVIVEFVEVVFNSEPR